MVRAMGVSHGDFVGLLPKQVDDVDGLARVVHPKDSAQPSLPVDRSALETNLQAVAARLDAQVGNRRIKSKLPDQRNALAQLGRFSSFFASFWTMGNGSMR